MKFHKLVLMLPLLASKFAYSYTTEDTRLLRFADIHKDKVTFVYTGDIYIANHKTGESQRLTDHTGFETFHKFPQTVRKLRSPLNTMAAVKSM